jgi:predicted Zn-dependent protease
MRQAVRLAAPLLFILCACAKVPVTGRRSLALVPDSYVNAMSLDSYHQLIQSSKLSQDPQANAQLKRVGERIAAVTEQKDYKWEFNLIDDPKTENAFCMPGGKVAFYTGILPICENEAGMAVVMGHEVAHAIAKHGSERMSQQLLLMGGEITLQEALRNKPAETRQMADLAFGLGSSLGYVLPYGRMQESEADHIGLIYMAEAGYDPREAIAFWQRMSAQSKGQPPEFLSTHPSHETRVQDLQRWLPEAQKAYEKSKFRGQ